MDRKRTLTKYSLLLWKIFRTVLLIGLSFIILQPFVVKTLMACMAPEDLMDSSVSLVPKHFSAYYWQIAWDTLDIGSGIWPTLLVSLITGILQLISSSMVGYGLARVKFKGRGVFFALIFIIMLVPPQTYSMAQYLRFVDFGVGPLSVSLTNSFIPQFMMSIGGLGLKQGLYIYLFYVIFRGLPKELEDAANIDGLGSFGTFVRVMIPNAKNIFLTVFLFSFCWQWTDVSYTNTYFTDRPLLASRILDITVRVGITYDNKGTAIARNAACLIIMVPLILIFIFGQKKITQSITTSGQAN